MYCLPDVSTLTTVLFCSGHGEAGWKLDGLDGDGVLLEAETGSGPEGTSVVGVNVVDWITETATLPMTGL